MNPLPSGTSRLNPSRFHRTVVLTILSCALLLGAATGQQILYDNGPDPGNIFGWPISDGYTVANSFTLDVPSLLTAVNVSLYDVNKYNVPLTLDWQIRDVNRNILAEGSNAAMRRISGPQVNYFLLNQWGMEFQVPPLELPAGTYWLELRNAVNTWQAPTFWGENNGPSKSLYTGAVGGIWKHGGHDHGGSESFQVLGTPQLSGYHEH